MRKNTEKLGKNIGAYGESITLAECRKLIRIARDFHFTRFPVDKRVDFFQPWKPKDERLGSEVRDEHVDRRRVSTNCDVHAYEVCE